MLADVLIGGAVFGGAAWFIVRSVRLNRRGRCAGCALKERCGTACGAAPEEAERKMGMRAEP